MSRNYKFHNPEGVYFYVFLQGSRTQSNIMALITLNISDNQINFFLELIERFDFVKIESKSATVELTEKHKNILEERLENYNNNPDSYINLEEAKENTKGEA